MHKRERNTKSKLSQLKQCDMNWEQKSLIPIARRHSLVKEGRSLQNHCHFVRIYFPKTSRGTQHMGQQFWLLWKNISLNKSSPRDCFSICTHTFYSTSLLVATKDPCIIYPTTFSFSSKWYCKNVLQFQRIVNNYIQFPGATSSARSQGTGCGFLFLSDPYLLLSRILGGVQPWSLTSKESWNMLLLLLHQFVVSASSDQQIGKIHHPLLGSKQRAAAATNVNQFPDALPLDQPAVAPLDHDLAAASLFDQPAAGLANGPSTYVLTTNKCDAWNFASRICHLLILQLE